jgi:hypothetical protein
MEYLPDVTGPNAQMLGHAARIPAKPVVEVRDTRHQFREPRSDEQVGIDISNLYFEPTKRSSFSFR